jgi:hypothetical protein
MLAAGEHRARGTRIWISVFSAPASLRPPIVRAVAIPIGLQ